MIVEKGWIVGKVSGFVVMVLGCIGVSGELEFFGLIEAIPFFFEFGITVGTSRRQLPRQPPRTRCGAAEIKVGQNVRVIGLFVGFEDFLIALCQLIDLGH